MLGILLAAILFETSEKGIAVKIESETASVNPAESVFLRLEVQSESGKTAQLPDLRDRVVGFTLAEDFLEAPQTNRDGTVAQVANWRLVPKPCEKVYKLKPFVVKASPKLFSSRDDEGKFSLVAGPVYFGNPAAREPVTGGMEVDPKKDLPPLSWHLVGTVALGLLIVTAVLAGLFAGIRYLVRRVKEHRMSPIERAWVELERLLKKGLPGRGRYKDFYVELTMVVRRYVQRKYGIRAPNLTTEEFFAELAKCDRQNLRQTSELKEFLEAADMVKFAGVEATPEMADAATDSARSYLQKSETPDSK